MTANENDLFDFQDFNSIKISVTFHNLTASTGVAKDHRKFGSKIEKSIAQPFDIKLVEFKENEISLDAPEKSAAKGHTLEVFIDVDGTALPFSFSVKGKLVNVTPVGSGRERLDLVLLEFDATQLEALKTIYRDRQSQIEEFLAQVKGY